MHAALTRGFKVPEGRPGMLGLGRTSPDLAALPWRLKAGRRARIGEACLELLALDLVVGPIICLDLFNQGKDPLTENPLVCLSKILSGKGVPDSPDGGSTNPVFVAHVLTDLIHAGLVSRNVEVGKSRNVKVQKSRNVKVQKSRNVKVEKRKNVKFFFLKMSN